MLAHRILLDLVTTYEECNHRDCVAGWRVCFRRCLFALIWLSDAGCIRQTGAAGDAWSILPTEKGIKLAHEIREQVHDYRGTIAALNS